MTIIINGPFIDAEGNDTIALGVRAKYTSDKLQRLNYDYFESYTYTKPERIIEAANDYHINPLYLD